MQVQFEEVVHLWTPPAETAGEMYMHVHRTWNIKTISDTLSTLLKPEDSYYGQSVVYSSDVQLNISNIFPLTGRLLET